MYKEGFYEEGLVKEVKEGLAVIKLADSDNCRECAIKFYCKPGDLKERTLTARDPYGVSPGDTVRVQIKEYKIISASIMIYGFPLIFLIAGILAGMEIFNENKEIYSTLLGSGLAALYILLLSYFSRNSKNKYYPEIVFVSSLQIGK